MKRPRFTLGSTRYAVNEPPTHIGNIIIKGGAVGFFVALAFVAIALIGHQAMRIFLAGVAVVGALIGIGLWLKHR